MERLALTTLALAAFALALFVPALSKASTLDTVRSRGSVACGVGESFPGFFAMDSQGVWHGLDVDFCRALSAAIFGNPNQVAFRVATPVARFVQLQSGEVDVLSRSVTWTLSREAGQGLEFTGVTFFDGQGFMVRRASGITVAAQLSGAAICTQTGTTTERNLSDWFTARKLPFTPVVFETADQAIAAYEAQRCDAYTTDRSTLASRITRLHDPAANLILPDTITMAANGPVVRRDDPQWAALVRWTLNALIAAEVHGVTSANVDTVAKATADPETRRLLGVNGGLGKFLGLGDDWAASAIRAVGNYGEIYARNLGGGLGVVIPREGSPNRLARDGGLLFSPSFE
jgi:general L-amino acid transport system substrate-binding protein